MTDRPAHPSSTAQMIAVTSAFRAFADALIRDGAVKVDTLKTCLNSRRDTFQRLSEGPGPDQQLVTETLVAFDQIISSVSASFPDDDGPRQPPNLRIVKNDD